jgi:hypothetical protein
VFALPSVFRGVIDGAAAVGSFERFFDLGHGVEDRRDHGDEADQANRLLKADAVDLRKHEGQQPHPDHADTHEGSALPVTVFCGIFYGGHAYEPSWPVLERVKGIEPSS